MPYAITYIEENGGVIATYSGITTDEDIIECTNERFLSDEKTRTYKYLVSDYSHVTEYKITPAGMKEMARLAVIASKVNPNIVLLGVTPTDLEYGMARLWNAYADDDTTGWETILVRSIEDANEWIEQNLKKA